MIAFFRSLLCRHRSVSFVQNLYGDQIIEWGWKRSVWRCDRCGALVGRADLHHPDNYTEEKR